MMFIVYFVIWTFVLYWIHRIVHVTPYLKDIHWDHHKTVMRAKYGMGWQLNNLWLYNDTFKSTVDLWITEVIPTIIFSWVTGHWWIFILYYCWAAFWQENLEHNKDVDIFLMTPGMWHMIHHRHPNLNFGLFFSIWDIIFKTNRPINYIGPLK